MDRLYKRGIVLLVVLGAALALASGVRYSTAEQASRVGYIDRDGIVDAYAGAQISMVINERDRLQREFDQESANLATAEKQALFAEYERRLASFEESVGIEKLMQDIERAIREAAAENGVDVVLDVNAVVYGGVDLTWEVAERLGL